MSVIKYKKPDGTAAELDERDLLADDESQEKWCPGWLAGDTFVTRGVIVSRMMALREANVAGWPENHQVFAWRRAIGALLHRAYAKASGPWVQQQLDSAEGEYRIMFAGLLRKHKVVDVAETFFGERDTA